MVIDKRRLWYTGTIVHLRDLGSLCSPRASARAHHPLVIGPSKRFKRPSDQRGVSLPALPYPPALPALEIHVHVPSDEEARPSLGFGRNEDHTPSPAIRGVRLRLSSPIKTIQDDPRFSLSPSTGALLRIGPKVVRRGTYSLHGLPHLQGRRSRITRPFYPWLLPILSAATRKGLRQKESTGVPKCGR